MNRSVPQSASRLHNLCCTFDLCPKYGGYWHKPLVEQAILTLHNIPTFNIAYYIIVMADDIFFKIIFPISYSNNNIGSSIEIQSVGRYLRINTYKRIACYYNNMTIVIFIILTTHLT